MGKSSDVVCQSCEWRKRRDAGGAPLWDNILRTDHWDVVHANSSSLEGWLVLVVRRHAPALADLTDDEAAELGPLIKQVSQALHDATGCVKTYAVQFAEHPEHRHVHVHVIPRQHDLAEDLKGPGIFNLLGVDASELVSEARMTEIAQRIRDRAVAPP